MISVHNIIFFSSFITELKNTIETQINEVKQQIEGELDPISGQKLGALYQCCIKIPIYIFMSELYRSGTDVFFIIYYLEKVSTATDGESL